MVSTEEMRALLPQDQAFTDKEVERIRETMEGFADAMFDKWLRERNAHAYGGSI